MLNKNTIEKFKECDKSQILLEESEKLFDNIVNGNCLEDPSLLTTFILLSYGDFKTFNFYFWFAFPASIEPIFHESAPVQKITDLYSAEEIVDFSLKYNEEKNRKQLSFFLTNDKLEIKYLKDLIKHDSIDKNLTDVDLSSIYFCFSDPSEYENPGWNLRNYVFMLLKLCPILIGKQIKIFSVRVNEQLSLTASLIFTLDLHGIAPENFEKSKISWTGWEKNIQGKLLPKKVQMGNAMDPIKLSEHFSNLNLKLMKWRLLPEINLDIIKSQKCLLFGAGTLGCAIARNLLSWGATNITFVDYGNVSYSNPVRQYLYTHEDAAKNRKKATTAAERLQQILPSVVSKISLSSSLLTRSVRFLEILWPCASNSHARSCNRRIINGENC